jgi:hypothetical protein
MINYRDVVLDPTGNGLQGISVTVLMADEHTEAVIYDEKGHHIGNPMKTDHNGEFEFYAANGIYTLHIFHASFNKGIAKRVRITIFDPSNIDESLAANLYGPDFLIRFEKLPFRIFVVANQIEAIALQTKTNDIVIVENENYKKYIKKADGLWAVLDVVASVAGKIGDVKLETSDIEDFEEGVKSLANAPLGLASLDINQKLLESQLPDNISLSAIYDISTGIKYRLVVDNGEIMVRPVI